MAKTTRYQIPIPAQQQQQQPTSSDPKELHMAWYKYPLNGGSVVSDDNRRHRSTNEDTYSIVECRGREIYSLFDGHGGQAVAQRAQRYIAERVLVAVEARHESPDHALRSEIRAFDELIMKAVSPRFHDNSGATALMAHYHRHFRDGTTRRTSRPLTIANLGDSRALVVDVTDGRIVLETRDHALNDPDERKRVGEANIRFDRIGGVLQVPRALGNYELKNSLPPNTISASADIYTVDIPIHRKYALVMACDGVWDVCSSRDVALLVHRFGVLQAASKITQYALGRQSTDNITVMVIPL